MYVGEFYSNIFASHAYDEDVPYALCRTNQATSVMIPGKKYSLQWLDIGIASEQYGYTVAFGNVCVEIKPKYVIGDVDFHHGNFSMMFSQNVDF